MIRSTVLFALLAVIVYCAAAPRAKASAYALAVPADARARRQFLPGTMAALHAVARNLAVSRPAPLEPSA